MTDYEYADLFASFLTAQNAVFANFMAVVTAMLVASWLVAPKLGWKTTTIFLFIYSVWTIGLIGGLAGVFGDFARLGQEIARVSEAPTTKLGWLTPVLEGPGMMSTMFNVVMAGAVLSYLASIVFFFLVRHRRIQ